MGEIPIRLVDMVEDLKYTSISNSMTHFYGGKYEKYGLRNLTQQWEPLLKIVRPYALSISRLEFAIRDPEMLKDLTYYNGP